MKNWNYKKILFGLLVVGFLVGASFFVYDKVQQKQVSHINEVLKKEVKSLDECKTMYSFDATKHLKNKYFHQKLFEDGKKECRKSYSLSHIDNCFDFIVKSDSYFENNFLETKNVPLKRQNCYKKDLQLQFSSPSFFNVYDAMNSSLKLEFNYHLLSSDHSDANGKDAQLLKNRILSYIQIEPKVPLQAENLDFYNDGKNATLKLALAPKTKYTIGFMDKKKSVFTFETPEKKYFSMRIKNPVSLYTTNNLPKFEILEFASEKKKANVLLCQVSEEEYAKIEVFSKTKNKKESLKYFKNTLKKSNFKNCASKELKLNTTTTGLHTTSFDFNTTLQKKGNGLYVVFFENPDNVEFAGKLNKPLFFSVIDSHILMKVSREGKGLFFVNDFTGKPLINQEISVYVNDFKEYERKWDYKTRKHTYSSYLAENKDIFSKAIILGKTDKNGILEVNLQDKIQEVFGRTFENKYDDSVYKSFFVKSSGKKHLSYLTSTWNAGIEPWNFGYKTGWGNGEENISLQQYNDTNAYNAHIYTDRVLYLPGEQVHIKGVVRTANNVSIPNSEKEFTVIIRDAKWKEILNKKVTLNEFGSFSEVFDIEKDSALGYYTIEFKDENKNIANSRFNVEIFKNPKFKNEVSLTTSGLRDGIINIETTEKSENHWEGDSYKGNFNLKAGVSSTYYNGTKLKNSKFTYKVFKQRYFDDAYWADCYYGCYWTPGKEFYTEGKGKLDANGFASFNVPVAFSSSYDDYKYIVEVTITDSAGDTITGSNSIIAKLPEKYKKYNWRTNIRFQPQQRFIKSGEKLQVHGGLNKGKWSKSYNDVFALIVKRKTYTHKNVTDVNGFERNIQKTNEQIEDILFINDTNFSLGKDGKLSLNKVFDTNGEYIFEYGKINTFELGKLLGKPKGDLPTTKEIQTVFKRFKENKDTIIQYKDFYTRCLKWSKTEKVDGLLGNLLQGGSVKDAQNAKKRAEPVCELQKQETIKRTIELDNLMSSKEYFSVIVYDENVASNPIKDDNKLDVLSEKVSYKVGETAKILVRLPVKNAKILITTEKKGVIDYEYIDVKGNVFFKEIPVTDNFAPNTYIGVFMIDTNPIPRYKVGYAEIVIDKTDKKASTDIKTNKKTYTPREEVVIDLHTKNQAGKGIASELTVMVVDDSLISLMGNIDANTLEKIFIKLPFSIQTSMTNIAMLRDYYFSRIGLVGGSGFGNFKGGDSAVSSRNIFKNTAYYNPSLITDANGKAQVKFTLPDNLTNFRVMVISNAKTNNFGYNETFIEVRKPVVLEDKTPIIVRNGDELKISSLIFNNTGKDMGFKVNLDIDAQVENKTQNIKIKNGKSKQVFWNIKVKDFKKDKLQYTVSALGNSPENSDKVEKTIEIKESPILITEYIKTGVSEKKNVELSLKIPENTDINKTKVEVTFSNNRLVGIENIAKSLAKYPYGCAEQTASSTIPNVILKQYGNIFSDIFDTKELQKNIDDGIKKLEKMQGSDGGFVYWEGDSSSSLYATPYVLRSLIYMKNAGENVSQEVINKAISYLEKNYKDAENLQKAEIYWTLKLAGKNPKIDFDYTKFDRHSLIAFTYGLIQSKNQNKELIEANIELIKNKFKKDDNSYWYWNKDSDRAIFTSLLIDYDFDTYFDIIDKNIEDFYAYNWNSYYYSTQFKNNAFDVFIKYLEKTKSNANIDYGYSLGKIATKTYKNLGTGKNGYKKEVFSLSDLLVVGEDAKTIPLKIFTKQDRKLYATLNLKHYPKDILKINNYTNGIKVQKEVFEVVDENKLSECSKNNYQKDGVANCEKALKKFKGTTYKRGTLYKAQITVSFDDDANRNNIILEDYLPASFRVINSKFKTELSSIKNANKNWSWDYREFRPEVVMANSSYWWGKEQVFEYYFKPEFEGKFINPPVSAYEMYNPEVRAYSGYEKIEVK